MEVPQKTENRTTTWSSDSTFEYLSKGNKNTNSKRHMHTAFIAAYFSIAKIWKQPKSSSVDEWIKKHAIFIQQNIIKP